MSNVRKDRAADIEREIGAIVRQHRLTSSDLDQLGRLRREQNAARPPRPAPRPQPAPREPGDLKARSTPEGRRRAQGLEMAAPAKPRGIPAGGDNLRMPAHFPAGSIHLPDNPVGKDGDPETREAFERVDREVSGDEADPVAGHVEDFPLPTVIEKGRDGGTSKAVGDGESDYATTAGDGEGNEDGGNYGANPEDLYQPAGPWPNDLWTDTSSEPAEDDGSYYLSKTLGDAAATTEYRGRTRHLGGNPHYVCAVCGVGMERPVGGDWVIKKAEVDASREPYGGIQGPDPEQEGEEWYLNRAAYADRALAAACEGVLVTAVAKGIDGADVRTALAVLTKGTILGGMGFDPQRADWTGTEGYGLGTTLERVARRAKGGGFGTLYNAATTTKDLVDKFRPATYDDIRQGVDAADTLLENLGYDEPTVRKANRDLPNGNHSESARNEANWYRDAGTAVRRALEALSSDEVARAVGDDRSLQLADAREELELLMASMALDSRVRLGDQDTTIHGEGAGGFGRGEMDVINNVAEGTLEHVQEADALLDASDRVAENPIPSGQRTQGGPGGFGGDPDGNGQGVHNALHHTPADDTNPRDTHATPADTDPIDPKAFTEFVYGPEAQRAQWETGQGIADAAWGGEGYDQTETFQKGQTGQPGWQLTDPTGGLWDGHSRENPMQEDGDYDTHDPHPNGDSGRALEATVVSRAGDPDAPEGFKPEPDEDAPEPGRVPVDPDAEKPRIYKASVRKEDATDMTTHVGGGRTFNDGPMPSHGTFRTVAQHVPSVQSIESQEPGGGARSAELDGPVDANLDTTPNRGDTTAMQPTKRGSSRVRRSTGVPVGTGPSPVYPAKHLQVPDEAVDTEGATETREPDLGHYIPDADQRGADVNPLSLAQGDDDVRVLSRAYAQLFRNVVSDPTVRFAVLRRAADGTEQEIAVDWDD